MENKTNVINQVSYNIQEKKLTLLYDNNTTEELILSQETYKKLFENWFTEVQMFISDKHKDIIRLLNFDKIISIFYQESNKKWAFICIQSAPSKNGKIRFLTYVQIFYYLILSR